MDEKIVNQIIEKAHKEQDWKTNEVRVDEVERLRHGACSFYTAGHKVRPLSYQLNYAALPGGSVLSLSDDHAAGKILQTCGSDAPATWWAEIITRFHQDLGSGIVLEDEKQNAGAIRKIVAAKKEFQPPKLSDSPSGKTISYYLLEPESFSVYSISAVLDKDGAVTVTKTSP